MENCIKAVGGMVGEILDHETRACTAPETSKTFAPSPS